jgi:hypothetical protein
MNYLIIVLGVVIVVLLVALYYYFFASVKTLVSSVSLKNNQLTFTNKDLKDPGSVHYAYGIWLFINTWNTGVSEPVGTPAYQIAMAPNGGGFGGTPLPNGDKPLVIFQRQDSSKMMLYLDSNAPSLYYNLQDMGGVSQRQLITNNFPIQTWTQIIFSVDNNIVDVYLNGKLILSNVYAQGLKQPSSVADNTTTPSTALQLGNSAVAFDATAASLYNWSSIAVDPQTAWNSYMSGPGKAVSAGNTYHFQMQFLKNSAVQSNYRLY